MADAFGQLHHGMTLLSDRTTEFADHLARAMSSVQGFTETFRGLSRTVIAVGAGLTAFGGKLGAIVGLPLAAGGSAGAAVGGVFGAASNLAASASPNGLDSVNKAFDLLAGEIGTLVIPGFVMLGGLALIAAEAIKKWIGEHRTDIIDAWAQALKSTVETMQSFKAWWDQTREGKGLVGENMSNLKLMFTDPGRAMGKFLDDVIVKPIAGAAGFKGAGLFNVAEIEGRRQAQGDGRIGGKGGGFGELAEEKGGVNDFLNKWADANNKIIRDMAKSMGVPSITDPVSKWKEVAMSLQKSQLEAEKLRQQAETVQLLRDINNGIRQLANPGGAALPAVIPIVLR